MAKQWFRNKTYGFGWYPSCWQGWAALAVYLLVVFITMPIVASITATESMVALIFATAVFIETAIFLFITYKKGDKLEWKLWQKK